MKNYLDIIDKFIKENSDRDVLKSSMRFFKEDIKAYGVKFPLIHKFSREFSKQIKDLSKNQVFDLCESLWASHYLEKSIIASNLSYYLKNDYQKSDFIVFERWVEKYISNWATCDTFCSHNMGEFLMKFPKFVSEMKKWAIFSNLWLRRSSAVSLILPIRRGFFMNECFEIAEILLNDKEDLVQKGYGWMLKVASDYDQKRVFDFVILRKNIMPRTALRYAIEKMPERLKKKAMEK